MTFRLRTATPDDLPWLLDALPAMDAHFGARRSLIPSGEYARDFLTTLIAHHVVFVATDETGPVGCIAGIRAPHPLNPAITVLSEQFWWVSATTARRAEIGLLLLNVFDAVGRTQADWTVMMLQSSSPIGAKALARRGYREQERVYLRERSV